MLVGSGRWLATMALLLGTACSDVVVGQFDGTGSDDGEAMPTTETTVADTTATATAADETTSGVPYTCISDDFEDGVISEDMWNIWIEQDASVEETTGLLKFKPPSFGVFDAGIAGTSMFEFPFEDGRARVEVGMMPPPDHPAGLFLIVGEEPDVAIINVGTGNVSVRRSVNEEPTFAESFPVETYPQWISIRSENSVLYFETSDDGVTWTTLTTSAQPQPYTSAHALIMGQTYGNNPEQGTVAAADFEVCVR